MEKVVSSKVIFQGRVFAVKELQVELAPGKIVSREVVDKGRDSIAVVPIDDHKRVYLISEYSAATDERTLCLPKGMIEPGESSEDAASRELEEEVGLRGSLRRLAVLTVSPGYLTQRTTIFLATQLQRGKRGGDEDHELEVHIMRLADVCSSIAAGRISEARTIAGIALAREALSA
jgi:ADP-ribose pyrophosphatase